jgi:hypothetical protein
MDPVEENHSLRADRFKQQVVRLDAYWASPLLLSKRRKTWTDVEHGMTRNMKGRRTGNDVEQEETRNIN